MTARAEGHATGTVFTNQPTDADGHCRLALEPGARLTGTARTEGGQPIANAEVRTTNAPGRRTSSDARGRFVLADLGAGELRLRAAHPLHGTATATRTLGVGESAGWAVVLDAPHTIAGRVVDEAGVGLPGLHVEVRSLLNGRTLPRTVTGDDGRFSVKTDSPDRHVVTVTDRIGIAAAHRARVEVSPDESEIDIVVTAVSAPTAFLSGTVVRPRGCERAAVTLAAYCEATGWMDYAGAGPDGRFRFGPLSPGRYTIEVQAYRTGFAARSLGTYSIGPHEQRDVGAFELAAPAALRLEAVRHGRPVTELVCLLVPPEGRPIDLIWHRGRWVPSQSWSPGRYRLKVLASATTLDHELDVEIIAGETTTAQVELPPGKPCHFVLTQQPAPVTASGELRRAGGDARRVHLSRGRLELALARGRYELVLDTGGRTEFVVADVRLTPMRVVVNP